MAGCVVEFVLGMGQVGVDLDINFQDHRVDRTTRSGMDKYMKRTVTEIGPGIRN